MAQMLGAPEPNLEHVFQSQLSQAGIYRQRSNLSEIPRRKHRGRIAERVFEWCRRGVHLGQGDNADGRGCRVAASDDEQQRFKSTTEDDSSKQKPIATPQMDSLEHKIL